MSFSDKLRAMKAARKERKKNKKEKKIKLVQPAAHRRGDLQSTGAVRSFSGEEKRERRKVLDVPYIVRALTQVFVALFAFGLVLYFGYHLVREFTPGIATAPVRTLTETEYRNATGYVIRSEKPLRKSVSGAADYAVREGQRVAKGETICSFYDTASANVKREIEELDGEIALLEKSLVAETVPRGIVGVTEDVNGDYDRFMKALSAGNYRTALNESEALCSDLGRMKVLSKDGSGIYDRYLALASKRESLIAGLGSPSGRVTSDTAGYYYYECDGYEDIFNEKLVKEFTESNLNAALSSLPADTSGTFGKIAVNPDWYLAVICDGFDMSFLESGDSCNIVFSDNGDRTVAMKLEKKLRTGSGMMLLFSSDGLPEGFRYTREQNVRLEYKTVSGYRVPISAVHSYEGMTGVFTLNGGYVNFRKINVLSEGEGYYIVSSYGDIEPGEPLTYRVFPYSERGAVLDYAAMHEECARLGLRRTRHDNGGIRLRYGENFVYYFYLNDRESVILNGSGLYHGKVMS